MKLKVEKTSHQELQLTETQSTAGDTESLTMGESSIIEMNLKLEILKRNHMLSMDLTQGMRFKWIITEMREMKQVETEVDPERSLLQEKGILHNQENLINRALKKIGKILMTSAKTIHRLTHQEYTMIITKMEDQNQRLKDPTKSQVEHTKSPQATENRALGNSLTQTEIGTEEIENF